MTERLILVNGLPGVGKTTLARDLGSVLDAAVISKDAIKESVADALQLGPAESGALGGAAMEMAWTIAAAVPGTVIIDTWLFAPRDRRFAEAGIEKVAAAHTVELWCTAPVDVVRDRYRSRRRHEVHRDADRLGRDWEMWAAAAEPLGLCPSIVVDTSTPVDVGALARDPRLEPAGDGARAPGSRQRERMAAFGHALRDADRGYGNEFRSWDELASHAAGPIELHRREAAHPPGRTSPDS
ncbi:AAA family ATPase [Pseudactinotalea sp.]|uniref:AAA family ATPase n=1 Tax=Pseudactinotalea sp. TaxID=1926260 RepID=UPI003B3B2694